MKICLPKKSIEKLREAFKNKELSMNSLYKLGSSEARIEALSKYVGDGAKFANQELEKAFISPKVKLALKNWSYKFITGKKPLYSELSLEQSKNLSGLNINDLKKLDLKGVAKKLAEKLDNKTAVKLAKRFENAKKIGNLANWEERVKGTSDIRTLNKVKGEFGKLKALDDLGVLNPKQVEQFMGSFVESKLGIPVSLEQSQKISDLTKQLDNALNKANTDWTFNNKNNIVDYFVKRDELNKYLDTLKQGNSSKTISDIMRANMLGSPRTLENSALYQALPGIERTLLKRLVSSKIGDTNYSLFEKIQASMSVALPNKEMLNFIRKQTAMTLEIYYKTGYDISRMETLDAGTHIFGEKFGSFQGKKFKEAQGIKEKSGAVLRAIARKTNLAPKWMAGSTDVIFAGLGRADTATKMSKEIAKLEAMKGKLPSGMSKEERATQLLIDSHNFIPKTEEGKLIRNQSIFDAHRMNGTQYNAIATKLIKFRNSLNMGKFSLGDITIPFLKIPATVKLEGVKVASGKGIYDAVKEIHQGAKLEGFARQEKILSGVNNLVRYLGYTSAAIFLTTLWKPSDYVGSWDTTNHNRYILNRARNATTDMVRIRGKWIPLSYFPVLNVPIATIMEARQEKERGNSIASGALKGLTGSILSLPVIKEMRDISSKKLSGVAKSQSNQNVIKSLGLDKKTFVNWSKVRVLPSFISYDLYNKAFPPETKYDFLGRKIKGANWLGARENTDNDLLKEMRRLDKVKELPTITGVTQKTIEKLKERHPRSYNEILQQTKRELAAKNMRLIKSDEYQRKTDNEKKKALNANRRKYLINKLKEYYE